MNDWDRIPELVQKAFRIAMAGKPGPVQLDVPDEMFYVTGEEDSARVIPPERYRVDYRLAGNPELVIKAAKMLADAAYPLVHAGGGVKHSKAASAVRGSLPEDHPQYFQSLSPATHEACKKSDVVLVVGSQVSETEFRGQYPDWGKPETQKIIQIDIDPTMLALNREVDLAIIGDAKRVVEDILEQLKGITDKRKPVGALASLKQINDTWREELFQTASDSPDSPVHPGAMAKAVRWRKQRALYGPLSCRSQSIFRALDVEIRASRNRYPICARIKTGEPREDSVCGHRRQRQRFQPYGIGDGEA